MKRYLEDQIRRDLERKMVFVGGPRQVGKTYLARQVVGRRGAGYLNWDVAEDREQILRRELPAAEIWAFDEIHKYRGWRNYLKGLYDKERLKQRILVTGSARLDLYRFGGDSLQGRYHYLRLHPLSFAELGGKARGDLADLLALGGFPEPFLGGSKDQARRWSREYRSRLVRDEILSLERVQDLGNLELLMLRLPNLVGSPLSINSLREDLQLSHTTVAKWLDIFERFYAIFRLAPFGAPRLKAVKKERKHYHIDWSLVPDAAARFENLVACHLLKWVHFEEDTKGRDLELRYFRDVEGREVDFIVVEAGKPVVAVECKLSAEDSVSPHLAYFTRKFPAVESYQVVANGTRRYINSDGIQVLPAVDYLKTLV